MERGDGHCARADFVGDVDQPNFQSQRTEDNLAAHEALGSGTPGDGEGQQEGDETAPDEIPGWDDVAEKQACATSRSAGSTDSDQTASTVAVDDDDDGGVDRLTSRRRRKVDENSEGASSFRQCQQQQHQQQQPQGQLNGQHRKRHVDRQHKQRNALVPARLVALLVDGSGQGWMAARRLWSVHEVGQAALTAVGLGIGDIDQDQEVG